jgi:PAS domain S-box-containing protein
MGLAESISDVFFAMDSNLRYTYWNKASENLTGISAKDAIRRSIFNIFQDTEDTRRAAAICREVLKTRQHQSFINEYRLDDKNFVFEISVNPTENGISNFIRDITERKRADEGLRELEKFSQFCKECLGGMIISCADKHVTDVNDALLKMHGCDSREEFVRWPAG